MNLRPFLFLVLLVAAQLAACTGNVASDLAGTCENELKDAREALDEARTRGLAGRIQWIKAANLISAATARQEIAKYDSCVEKVRRARVFLRAAEQPSE